MQYTLYTYIYSFLLIVNTYYEFSFVLIKDTVWYIIYINVELLSSTCPQIYVSVTNCIFPICHRTYWSIPWINYIGRYIKIDKNNITKVHYFVSYIMRSSFHQKIVGFFMYGIRILLKMPILCTYIYVLNANTNI